jgi:hypothetical protein
LRLLGGRRENARHLHDPILRLDDLDRVSGDLQAGSGFRDVLEMVEDQSV